MHTEEVILNLPTQLGKTTLLEALLIAISILDPGPGMLAAPDRDDARKVRDDIYSIIEASGLARYVPPENERNMIALRVQGVPWYLGWPGTSGQKLSGKSCRYVFCTEASKWRQLASHGKSQDLARERTKAWMFFKRIFESTPTDRDCFITQEYLEKSDMRRFVFPCPSCGHHQDLRWKTHHAGEFKGKGGVVGYTNEDGTLLDPDAALREAYYLCEHGCRIDERERPEMVSAGRWVPKGQWVDRTGTTVGEAERGPRVAGYNTCSLIGRTVSFGRMAAEWCRSEGDDKSEQNFLNHWWGRRYIKKAKIPQVNIVAKRLRHDVEQGMAPKFVRFLTTQVDVQPKVTGTEFPWMVMGYGPGGRCHIIDFGCVFSEHDVNEVLEAGRVYDHEDGGTIKTKWSCIDSSDGNTQEQVYRIARGVRFCLPVKGMTINGPEAFRLSGLDEHTRRSSDGQSMWERALRGETMLLGVNTDWTQSWLEQQLHGKEIDETSRLTVCPEAAMSRDFINELLNEKPEHGVNAKGLQRTSWNRINTSMPNDMRDLVRYGKTLAQLLTDNGRNWSDLPERKTSQQIKEQTRTVERPQKKVGMSITSGGGRGWNRR